MKRIDIIAQNGNTGAHYDIEKKKWGDYLKHVNDVVEGKEPVDEDVINNPSHYKLFPDMEVITAIEKVLTKEEYIGYCKGNILKYRLRAGKKDEVEQEIGKADVYRGWLDE